MNPQTFRAPTPEAARRSAHATLGDDARILVTKRVTQKGLLGLLGGTCFEVSAVVGQPPMASAAAPASPRHFARDAYLAEAKAAPPAVRPGQELSQLRSELRGEMRHLRDAVGARNGAPDLRAELEALHARLDELAEEKTPKAKRSSLLEATGIEGPARARLARAVARGEGDEATRLQTELSALLEVAPSPMHGKSPRTVSLIGPSGVGKTTTAAKIAARAMFDHGLSVTLVACDTFRVGAEAQLARYAELMGASFAAAQTANELAAIVRDATTDLVVCDHTGQPQDESDEAPLAYLRGRGPRSRERQVLLCVPATLRASDAADLAKQAAMYKPTALVVTKVDETRTPAGLVHASVSTKMPIALICHGPRVPEDVEEPTLQSLVARVVPSAASRGSEK